MQQRDKNQNKHSALFTPKTLSGAVHIAVQTGETLLGARRTESRGRDECALRHFDTWLVLTVKLSSVLTLSAAPLQLFRPVTSVHRVGSVTRGFSTCNTRVMWSRGYPTLPVSFLPLIFSERVSLACRAISDLKHRAGVGMGVDTQQQPKKKNVLNKSYFQTCVEVKWLFSNIKIVPLTKATSLPKSLIFYIFSSSSHD